MPKFLVDGALVVQHPVTVTIEAETMERALAIANAIEYDISEITIRSGFQDDAGDGFLDLETLREADDDD